MSCFMTPLAVIYSAVQFQKVSQAYRWWRSNRLEPLATVDVSASHFLCSCLHLLLALGNNIKCPQIFYAGGGTESRMLKKLKPKRNKKKRKKKRIQMQKAKNKKGGIPREDGYRADAKKFQKRLSVMPCKYTVGFIAWNSIHISRMISQNSVTVMQYTTVKDGFK